MAAIPAEADRDDLIRFSCGIEAQTYVVPGHGEVRREIPIFSLFPNALMVHAFTFPDRGAEDIDVYAHKLLASIMNRFGVPTTHAFHAGAHHFEFCFGTAVAKQDYYFPNPAAGFGINGWGNSFNGVVLGYTTRELRLAHLKSGSFVPNAEAHHRRYPTSGNDNYDRRRVRQCDRLAPIPAVLPGVPIPMPDEGEYCEGGHDHDICLTSEFQRERGIDGHIAIAGMDSIMKITDDDGADEFNTDYTMYRWLRNYYNKIQTIENEDRRNKHLALWNMNLLCLETDFSPNQGNVKVGFKEFVFTPFGHNSARRETIPPIALPFDRYGDDSYDMINQRLDVDDNVLRRKFRVRVDYVLTFLQDYVIPNLIVRPGSIVTSAGRIDFGDLEGFLANIEAELGENGPIVPGVMPMPNAPMMRLIRQVSINYRISKYFSDYHHFFDMKQNVFYREYNLNFLNIGFTANPGIHGGPPNGFNAANNYRKYGFPIGKYREPFRFNDFQLNATLLKIAHELISNFKWNRTNWMFDYKIPLKDPDNLDNDPVIRNVPVGPFYNSFSTNFLDRARIFPNMRRIVQLLEEGGGFHSIFYTILTTDYFLYLVNWANNMNIDSFELDGTLYGYTQGAWFPTWRNPDGMFNIGMVRNQAGGSRSTPRNLELNTVFVNNLRKGIKRNSMISNKNTRRSNRKVNKRNTRKLRVNTKASASTTDRDGGHTSTNIEELNNDHIEVLRYIAKNKNLKQIFSSFFLSKMPESNTKIDTAF